jgi:hypothetical protein
MTSTPAPTADPTIPDPYSPAAEPDSLPTDPDYAQPEVVPSHGDPDPGPGPVADPGQVPDREPMPGD